MLKILTDAGAQITKDLHELALRNGAHKIAQIMAAKLHIPNHIQMEDQRSKHSSLKSHQESMDAHINFKYNVNDDSKVQN